LKRVSGAQIGVQGARLLQCLAAESRRVLNRRRRAQTLSLLHQHFRIAQA